MPIDFYETLAVRDAEDFEEILLKLGKITHTGNRPIHSNDVVSVSHFKKLFHNHDTYWVLLGTPWIKSRSILWASLITDHEKPPFTFKKDGMVRLNAGVDKILWDAIGTDYNILLIPYPKNLTVVHFVLMTAGLGVEKSEKPHELHLVFKNPEAIVYEIGKKKLRRRHKRGILPEDVFIQNWHTTFAQNNPKAWFIVWIPTENNQYTLVKWPIELKEARRYQSRLDITVELLQMKNFKNPQEVCDKIAASDKPKAFIYIDDWDNLQHKEGRRLAKIRAATKNI